MVAGVDRDGEEILSPCRVEHAELESWLAKYLLPSDRVVIESTTNAWHVYDLLAPLVAEVLVAKLPERSIVYIANQMAALLPG